MAQTSQSVKRTSTKFQTTTEKFSDRAGLCLISRYLYSIGITAILTQPCTFLKKHAKGTSLKSFFPQLICFFSDGTDFPMSRFDLQTRSVARITVPKSRQLVSTSDGLLVRRRLKLDGKPEAVPFYPHEFIQRQSSVGLVDPSGHGA